jgi:hypothetical protein
MELKLRTASRQAYSLAVREDKPKWLFLWSWSQTDFIDTRLKEVYTILVKSPVYENLASCTTVL